MVQSVEKEQRKCNYSCGVPVKRSIPVFDSHTNTCKLQLKAPQFSAEATRNESVINILLFFL